MKTAGPHRICFMLDRLSRGGTEGHVLGLIENLDRTRFTPYLVLLAQPAGQPDPLEPADCEVLRLGVSTFRSVSALSSMFRFARALRAWKLDILQIYSPDSTYFGVPAARIAGVPAVIRTHRNTGYWMRPRDRVLQCIFARLVTWTIANGEACRRAAERAGADPAAISVIPNGIATERYRDWKAPSGAPTQDVMRVGVVANLRRVKRLDTLLLAAQQVAPKFPQTIFEIAGEGPERASLEALGERLGLGDRVRLRGVIEDVPSFVSSLDVAVLCSESEGLSNSVIEYMAAGRPIVATDVGGNPELVAHEKTGLLIPPNDPDALAAAILRLLEDPSLAHRLASAARERALREFTMEVQNRRYERVWSSLLHSSEARVPSGVVGDLTGE